MDAAIREILPTIRATLPTIDDLRVQAQPGLHPLEPWSAPLRALGLGEATGLIGGSQAWRCRAARGQVDRARQAAAATPVYDPCD